MTHREPTVPEVTRQLCGGCGHSEGSHGKRGQFTRPGVKGGKYRCASCGCLSFT